MKPIKFEGYNIIIAKDQKEYLPLPAFHSNIYNREDETGNVVSCWKLTWRERVKLLFTGRLYLSQLTFNQPLQPQRPHIENPLTPEAQAAGLPLTEN
jgi:hypothetical protein